MLKRRREKEKPIRLRIELKNFGPISQGEIALKPLTLFVGPNNSGKSYAAMLIHSIFESYTPILERGMPLFALRHHLVKNLRMYIFSDVLLVLQKQINELAEKHELVISKEIVEKLVNKLSEDIYEKRLSAEIVRSFACPLHELVRVGENLFEIKIYVNSYSTCLKSKKDKLKVETYPQLTIDSIRIKLGEHSEPRFKVTEKNKEVLIELGKQWVKFRDKEIMSLELVDVISNICWDELLQNVAMPCYYLPAARSGILQGHKLLAASIVRRAPYAGIEPIEIPKFSGVVSDFISSVLELSEEKGPFYTLAQDFEKELIKGEILVRTSGEHPYPEIKYNFHKTEISLHRASSTVSELAPLFLYLKYNIKPGSILIIEEPEAHLHPGNQRILAKFLIKLIRRGVNVTITTHSGYLLEQLSNFILLSRVKSEEREKRYKYNKEDFLNPDEVAAYVFKYDSNSGGHKITGVEINKEDGISDEEFLKINEAIYEETLKLRKGLSSIV